MEKIRGKRSVMSDQECKLYHAAVRTCAFMYMRQGFNLQSEDIFKGVFEG